MTETVTASAAPAQTVTAAGPTQTTTVPGPTETVTDTVTDTGTSAPTPLDRRLGCAPLIAQQVSLRAKPVSGSAQVLFTGTVRPHHHGYVDLQRFHNGHWHDAQVVREQALGRYSIELPQSAVSYQVRVIALSSTGFTRGVSSTVTVPAG